MPPSIVCSGPERGRAPVRAAEIRAEQQAVREAKASVAKARTRDSMLSVPLEDLVPAGTERGEVEAELRGLLRSYRRTLETDRRQLLEDFKFVHMARKVVGVGSVGTRASILLLLGRDGQDPLFLQAKEAEESVMERFVGKSQYKTMGSVSSQVSASCKPPATRPRLAARDWLRRRAL